MKQYSPEALNLLNAIADATGIADKNTVISLAISMLVRETGVDIKMAYELVFGPGSWEDMLLDVYNSLRANAVGTDGPDEFVGHDAEGFACFVNVKL